MAVVGFLAAAAIALFLVIPMAAGKYGTMVASRFIERTLTYSPHALRDWIAGDAAGARGYVFPVLFPLDLVFMIAFGGFCGFASLYCAGLASPKGSYHWLVVFDLAQFGEHLSRRLPAYACPVACAALDTTETSSKKKQQLIREGFDPLLVTDPLFFREPASGVYRELAAANYARILDGSIRL